MRVLVRRLRRALRDLAREKGDLKALEPPLHGYCRLRVGGYRIVFAYGKRGTIECIFAERRHVVHELLARAGRRGKPDWRYRGPASAWFERDPRWETTLRGYAQRSLTFRLPSRTALMDSP